MWLACLYASAYVIHAKGCAEPLTTGRQPSATALGVLRAVFLHSTCLLLVRQSMPVAMGGVGPLQSSCGVH